MGVYASLVLSHPNVKAFWDLDEVSGTSAADATGGGFTGTYAGTTTQNQPGQSGQSVAFDGLSGKVSVGTCPVTSYAAGVTLEAWFYLNTLSQATQCVMELGTTDVARGVGIFINGNGATDGRIGGLFPGLRWFGNSFQQLQAGLWNHVALTLSGSTVTLYLNGISWYSDGSGVGTAPVSGDGCFIGASSATGSFFNGRVDGAAIYNAALPSATLLAHYRAGEAALAGKRSFPARPPGAARVSRSSLTDGLVLAAPLGQRSGVPVNLVDGRPPTVNTSAPAWATGAYGAGDLDSILATGATYNWPHASVSQRSFSAEVWLTLRSFQTAPSYISALWSANYAAAGGTVTMRLGDTAVPYDRVQSSAGVAEHILLPGTHQVLLVGDASGQRLHVDGILRLSGAAATAVALTQSGWLRDDVNTGRTPDALVHQMNLWNRPLSTSEVGQRWAAPWGIYDPEPNATALFPGAAAPAFSPAWAKGANVLVGPGVSQC